MACQGEKQELALLMAGEPSATIAPFRPRLLPLSEPREVRELSDTELLAIILGSHHREVCETLTAAYADFRESAKAGPKELAEHGCTDRMIERLSALSEIAKRYGEVPFVPGQLYRCSADVYEYFREHLGSELVEIFVAVLLDSQHHKLRDIVVSKGSLTASIVHPRDVFAQVLRHAAAAVVLVHNHPSGDPTPSQADLEITRRLRQVGEIMGVRILDHIVIGAGRYVSFVDDGYW